MDITLNDEISTKSTNQIASSRAPCNFDVNDYDFDAEWINYNNDPCADLQVTINSVFDCDECSNCSIEEFHIIIRSQENSTIRLFDFVIEKGLEYGSPNPSQTNISPNGWSNVFDPNNPDLWNINSDALSGTTFILQNDNTHDVDVEVCVHIDLFECDGPFATQCLDAVLNDDGSIADLCKSFRFACTN